VTGLTLTKPLGMMKMNRKGPRPQVFVCASISVTGELITKVIPASSQAEAIELFTKQHAHAPKDVLGPFFKKRAQIIEKTRTLKFLPNQTKKAIYDDWLVNAFMLTEPVDQAYLVFIKRVDNKSLPKPQGTITVPVSDLRFI
jgi:hypothetical protein